MPPLLKPSECIVLLVEPFTDASIPDDDAVATARFRILQAATVCQIPALFATSAVTSAPSAGATPIHNLQSTMTTWAESSLGAALAATSKSSLLICGYWLDESVTFAALNALSEGYDVYLLADASPPLDYVHRHTATLRLVQAGVVPTTTRQTIREWAANTIDSPLRANLLALV